MDHNFYVVTGATGHIGGELVRLLLSKGKKVRAVGRSADRLKSAAAQGAEPVVADLEDKSAAARAFAGAGTAFALIPPKYDAPDFRSYQNKVSESLAAAVRSAGVRRVVHLSSVGAHLGKGTGLINGLRDSEERFNALDADVLHLRPAYFMENHLGGIGVVKTQGTSGGGLRGDLPIPMIATRDITAAAAEWMASGASGGKAVRYLLGPRDYTMAEAARILGRAIGKPDLGYVQFPYNGLRQAMLGMGCSADVAGLFVEMARGFNEGIVKPTRPRSPADTTPTSLEDFAPVFAAAYKA